jgi:DNA polymerase V
MAYLAVLDCNNFFVSCERLFRPDLVGKPVVVLSSNDGCVVARSQEIKDSGIPMGVPYFEVKDILKDIGGVCFSSHFALYRDISRRVFSVVKKYCGEIEQYSIDEAFFVIPATSDSEAATYVRGLKETVERQVGIPVSIGVSDTKTRAKRVNAYAKRNGGIGVFVGEDFVAEFGETSLGDIWGVGRQLVVAYNEAKLYTINDLLAAPTPRITKLFHKNGVQLQAELSGQSVYSVTRSMTIPKSVMSTRSFGEKTNDLSAITDALSYHVRFVCEELREQSLLAGGIQVMLYTSRHGDWRGYGGSQGVIFTLPTATTATVLEEAIVALKQLYRRGVPYAKTGVVAFDLVPAQFVPESLFSPLEGTNNVAAKVIDGVVDSLNKRFGRDTVKQGMFTKTPTWQTKNALRSPAYTTDWQSLQTVRA